VKAAAVLPVKVPSAPLGLTPGTELPPRPGQIAFEVVRAAQLGRATRQLLAVRVTLSVGMGMGPAVTQLFPLGSGMLDADDADDLARGVAEIARAAAAPPRNTGAESVDMDYRVGSLRVGLVRIGSEAVAYVQVGRTSRCWRLRPVWQAPTTMFLSVDDLSVLAAALPRGRGENPDVARQLARGPRCGPTRFAPLSGVVFMVGSPQTRTRACVANRAG